MTTSDPMAPPAVPIPLVSERRRRIVITLILIAVVIVLSLAFIALMGQAFGADPMTGT